MQFTTFGNLNENPVIRTLRYLVLAGLAGAVLAVINVLPGVDLPGNYDAIIIGAVVPVLAGLEKRIRDLNARAQEQPPAVVEPAQPPPTP